jgi:aquaporin Z
LSASFNNGIGLVGVALAFGLSVLTMAYAIGHISGCHLNPAVTIGLAVAGRFECKKVLHYIIAQVSGAVVGAAIIYAIIYYSKSGFTLLPTSLAVNGYDELSPRQYGIVPALISEFILTFMFMFVILGSTSEDAPKGFAPIAIGLCLTLVHLISIPITNTSVNPARSTGPALLVGGLALQQLWLFWLAPILGAVGAGFMYKKCSKTSCNS